MTIGSLLVIGRTLNKKGVYWDCKCAACGRTVSISSTNLCRLPNRTCGCLLKAEPKKWDKVDLAYLAGLIDGEGCITLGRTVRAGQRRGESRTYDSLTIVNTNRDVLLWVQEVFGGRIHANIKREQGWKTAFSWYATNPASVLKAILPYLKIKKRQAEIFLEFCATKRRYGKSRIPIDVEDRRTQIVAEIRRLNQRGCMTTLTSATN
jgi:hypothetical protein